MAQRLAMIYYLLAAISVLIALALADSNNSELEKCINDLSCGGPAADFGHGLVEMTILVVEIVVFSTLTLAGLSKANKANRQKLEQDPENIKSTVNITMIVILQRMFTLLLIMSLGAIALFLIALRFD